MKTTGYGYSSVCRVFYIASQKKGSAQDYTLKTLEVRRRVRSSMSSTGI